MSNKTKTQAVLSDLSQIKQLQATTEQAVADLKDTIATAGHQLLENKNTSRQKYEQLREHVTCLFEKAKGAAKEAEVLYAMVMDLDDIMGGVEGRIDHVAALLDQLHKEMAHD